MFELAGRIFVVIYIYVNSNFLILIIRKGIVPRRCLAEIHNPPAFTRGLNKSIQCRIFYRRNHFNSTDFGALNSIAS
jgi:hypothetical protein